jgi:hypothetical protein
MVQVGQLCPWSRGGELMELGRDQEAISSMLRHTTHTNWFEFQAGSRLVHLRFPICYRAMAQDGVPVWFEPTGPTTREAQPIAHYN